MRKLIPLFLLLILSTCSFAFSSKKINEIVTSQNLTKSQLHDLKQHELELFEETNNYDHYLNAEYVNILILSQDSKLYTQKLKAIIRLRNLSKNKNNLLYCTSSYFLALHLISFSPNESVAIIKEYLKIAHADKDLLNQFDYNSYRTLGNIAFSQKDYKLARYNWHKCVDICNKTNAILFLASSYNDIYLTYLNQGNLEKGELYIKKAIATISKKLDSKENKNFYYFLRGNYAELLMSKNKFESAENLLIESYNYFKETKNLDLFKVANLLIDISEVKKIRINLGTIETDLNDFLKTVNNEETKVDYIRIIYKIIKKKNDRESLHTTLLSALYYERGLYTKQINEQQTLYNELIKDTYKNLNLEYENGLKIQSQKNTIAYIITISSFLLLIGGFVYFRNIRKKSEIIQQQSRELEEKKEELYSNNLRIKEEQIDRLLINLELKNATEKTFLEKIKEVKKNQNVDIDAVLKDLQLQVTNLLQIDKKHNDSVIELKDQRAEFIERISLKHPQLSKGEKQLCSHIRLNLTSKEIALIEGVGPASVRVYKTNLKKKLKLKQTDNIYEYIQSL